MKSIFKIILLSSMYMCCVQGLHAQISGTINVPTASYPDLAAIINALNAQGVGAGGATINLLAANNQNAPTGGYQLGSAVLNASLSSTNRLKIIGNGNILTAPIGIGTLDAIFILKGVDYVTIDGLNLQENAANTAATQAMEWGYALLNRNTTLPTDGCLYDTIRNCTITLNRTIVTTSAGIYAGAHSTLSTAMLSTPNAGDNHSYNGFYSNNISNVVRGIYLNGNSLATSPTAFSQNNDIGGFTSTSGNSITNCVGNSYSGIGPITATYQHNINISNNTINNIANGGVAAIGSTWGIYVFGTGGACQFNNNAITMTSALINSTYFQYGIYANALNNDFTATGNTITLTQANASIAGPAYGIFNPNAAATSLRKNTIVQNMGVASSSSNYGIYLYPTATTNSLIDSNSIQLISSAASPSQFYNIAVANLGNNETITNNSITNTNVAFTGMIGYHMMIYTASAATNKTISGNYITGTYQTASSVPGYGIFNSPGVAPSIGNLTISGNKLSNISITTGTDYEVIFNSPGVPSPQAAIISGNTISNVTSTLASNIDAIYQTNFASSDVFDNNINTISTAAEVNAIYSDNTGTSTTNIFRNKIYNLTNTSTSTGRANGITIAGGASTKIYNNLVGLLKAPSGNNVLDMVRGINVISTQPSSNINLYFNSIYLDATSSGSNFSTSGIYSTSSGTPTTANIEARNNIIVNKSISKGSGNTTVYRLSAPGNNSSVNTNRNILYAGVPSANNVIYTDGTNTFQTIANYQAAATPIDANSFTENPPFASIIGSDLSFLHFNPSSNTYAESSGAPVTGIGTDFDNQIRFGNPGYTGNGTAVDIGADEFNNCASLSVSLSPINDTSCSASSADFSIAVSGASVYQWQINRGSGFSNLQDTGAFSGSKTSMLIVSNPPQYLDGSTYRVLYAAGPTCLSSTSAIAKLNVVGSPNTTVSLSGPATLCQGDSVKLTVPASGGNIYQWKLNGVNIPGATSNAIQVSSGGSYTVLVSSTSGCSATSTARVITVNPRPTSLITYNSPISFCAGSGVVLNVAGAPGVKYQWQRNGFNIANDTLIYHLATVSGAYTVVASNAFNCSTKSPAVTVTVFPKPQPVLLVNSLVLSTTQPYSMYQWLLSGQNINGATGPTYTMVSNGLYSVRVIDSNGCDNTSESYNLGNLSVVRTTGIAESIISYPNPASETVTIENKSASRMNSISILNALGQTVYNAETAVSRQTIYLNNLSGGLYTIRVNTDAGVVVKKLEVVK